MREVSGGGAALLGSNSWRSTSLLSPARTSACGGVGPSARAGYRWKISPPIGSLRR
ncbi:hypothetical protein ACIA5D_07800 [Actinoplanes sp. NPDC051513]|uniref:hypothetical protein n=1 Tax=Actinoplanes sp. NPDC051513 TaxID=3363908 RepID=UPI0037AB974D